MKTYDLRKVENNCLNNPAVALVDILARGEEEVKILVKKSDIPLKVLEEVARVSKYEITSVDEGGQDITVVLKRCAER